MGISVSVLLSRYKDYEPDILGIFTSHDTMRPAFEAVVENAHKLSENELSDAWDDMVAGGGFECGRTFYWYENHTLDELSVTLIKEEYDGKTKRDDSD